MCWAGKFLLLFQGTGGGVGGPLKGGPTDPWEVGYILIIHMNSQLLCFSRYKINFTDLECYSVTLLKQRDPL